jgi:alpha-ketoglutarate-dependent taurine dioxygenase
VTLLKFAAADLAINMPHDSDYIQIEEKPQRKFSTSRHVALSVCILVGLSVIVYASPWTASYDASEDTSAVNLLSSPLTGARGQGQVSQAHKFRSSLPTMSGSIRSKWPTSIAKAATSQIAAPVNLAPPPPSPVTAWGDRISDIKAAQAEARSGAKAEFPKTLKKADVLPADADKQAELAWLKANAKEIKDDMERNGAVVFRGFDLMKDQPGFQAFYAAIGMNACQDPLFSVAARPTADGDKNSPVYEAVNKESRKNFFIGMHNEFVGTRAPRAAAFVCFKSAEKGGEFIISDGRAVFRDLEPDVLDRLYNRGIRYGVMELPFFAWVDKLPEPVQPAVMGGIKGLASAAINAKVDFDVELLEQRGGYDNTRILQARAPSQVPVVRHPVTGEPTWFCNVHSHSAKLRKDRESEYGAEKFEDGASQINKSDMFYGDDGDLSDADLKHLDEVTKKNMQYIKMNEGDVVLLDNYKTMHGRNVFDGTRKHAVAWFSGWDGEDEQRNQKWNVR